MTMNIRNEADRAAIEAKGYTVVTVISRGDDKGRVVSKHKTYDAANRKARGTDLSIVHMDSAEWF